MENLKKTLKLFNCLAFLYSHCTDALTAVHRRASSEGHHCLTAVFSKQFQTFIYIAVCGIRLNTVINHIFNSCSIHCFKHSLRQSQIHKYLIGYNKNFCKPFFFYEGRKFFYCSCSFQCFGHTPWNQIHTDFEYSLINSAIHLSHIFSSLKFDSVNRTHLGAYSAIYAIFRSRKTGNCIDITVEFRSLYFKAVFRTVFHTDTAADTD